MIPYAHDSQCIFLLAQMLASVHGSILEGVCCGGYAQLYGNQACRGGRVEGVTNRGLCGRDGSAFDQDTVTKIRHYYHVYRRSSYNALTAVQDTELPANEGGANSIK